MKCISIAFALAALAGPALAVPPLPPARQSAVDAARLAAAERLLDAMDYDRMMSRMADAMVAQLGPTTKAAIEAELGDAVDDELIRRLGEVQEKYLRAQLSDDPKVRQAIALLYARHFTAADLDHLSVLQRDPVMQKWNDVAPALMGDMVPLLVGIVGKDRDAMQAELKQVVADYYAERQPEGES